MIREGDRKGEVRQKRTSKKLLKSLKIKLEDNFTEGFYFCKWNKCAEYTPQILIMKQ